MHDQDRDHGRESAIDQADRTDAGLYDRITSAGRWLWFLVVRNRVAIAIASLIWLAWRSGTQPRRLAYPCQQAAAANLGFLAILFIPGLSKLHQRKLATVRARAMAIATGSVCLAGVMFILISGGVAVYSEYAVESAADIPMATTEGTGTVATVSIVKNSGWADDAVIDQMVRDAVALAGGFNLQDNRGGGSAPWDQGGDGNLSVIVLTNPSGSLEGLYTDPRVTHTVVDLAWEYGADEVKIGACATGNNQDIFAALGYDSNRDNLLDHDTRVPIIDLNDTGTTVADGTYQTNNVQLIETSSSGHPGYARTSYYVHDELLKNDFMIVVPCIKNHNLGTITLGLKMRIGTAPQDIYYHPTYNPGNVPFLRWEMHNYLGQDNYPLTKFAWDIGSPPISEEEAVQRSLVDLNLVRPQDFVVLDATMGVENGPVPQDPAYTDPVNSIMASSDAVALDTIGALVEGYDPDQIPCLNMANDTQVLGVSDRRLIEVVGDHVQDVRVDFTLDHPQGYAAPTRAESVSPTLDDISLSDGQMVVVDGPLTVHVTGADDNVHVIKAELAMRAADGENLLINGDFESGDTTGWSIYRADWGTPGTVTFNSAVEGRVGDYVLHLQLNAGEQNSFAVYQEVPVTPGQKYRIDTLWKANKYGRDTWYEVMLIDGPFDVHQADTGGGDVVLNHMYAYDLNPGLSPSCPTGNEIPASFDWIWTHEMNNDPVDDCWSDRDGVRVASGNTMTVVLKTGSCCGTDQSDIWFDEVSLAEVSDDEVVAVTVADPGTDFDIVWDAVDVPIGPYEARVSVYDAMMNEATITRNVEVIFPQEPVIGLPWVPGEQTIFVGESCTEDTLGVVNIGIETLNYSVSVDTNWMAINPVFGSSTGNPANSHRVRFNCAVLDPGVHTGTITVTGNAYNSPQTIAVTVTVRTVPPDLDGDGDVDQTDFGYLQACLTGGGVGWTDPACEAADLDDDGDVDINDFGIMQACMSGANVPADPSCMP